MTTGKLKARVFRSGNGQAVLLPKGIRFKSKEVQIFRRGDEIVLREQPRGLGRVVDIIAELKSLSAMRERR